LAYSGCLQLSPERFHVEFRNPRYAYYLQAELWRRYGTDDQLTITYREIERRGPRPGSPLIMSLVVLPGVAGNPPRLRQWLWAGPGLAGGLTPKHCCEP